jgi:hypothetical protein
MPWAAAAAIGGAVIGGSATRSAAGKQADAAAAAAAEEGRQFDLIREDQAPYREAGVQALESLRNFQEPSLREIDVLGEPGYQFGLQQGRDVLEGSAAAGGGLYSGNTLKALTRYGNDYATTKYGDAWNRINTTAGNRWNRLASLAGIGQTANQQSAQAGMNYANALGQIGMSNANAQGAAGMARGQIWGNALNQVASVGNRAGWFGGNQQGGSFGPQLDPFYGGTGGSGD